MSDAEILSRALAGEFVGGLDRCGPVLVAEIVRLRRRADFADYLAGRCRALLDCYAAPESGWVRPDEPDLTGLGPVLMAIVALKHWEAVERDEGGTDR